MRYHIRCKQVFRRIFSLTFGVAFALLCLIQLKITATKTRVRSMSRRIISCFQNYVRVSALPARAWDIFRRLWRLIVLHRRALQYGAAAGGIVVMLLVGRADNAALDKDLLTREECLYRLQRARDDLDQKEMMVGIIEHLDHRLSSVDCARIAPIIVDEARHYGFDPLFLVAVIVTESSFGPTEVSHMGARGLMQIKPSVARAVAQRRGLDWHDADQLFDPAYNVRLGTHYLFELVGRFRSVKRAIIAYNYGETALHWRISTGQRLPLAYFKRVKNHYHVLREQFGHQVPWEPVQFDSPL
jgi:soluble lytic murein transglycosylase-like protein